jgi:hypothetical protein
MAEHLVKPSAVACYQMVKECAETGSFIPNIKTEYIAITVTFPNEPSTSALSNKGTCDWKQLYPFERSRDGQCARQSTTMQVLQLQKILHYEKTIDNFQQRQINAEKEH